MELDSGAYVTFNNETLAYNPWFLAHHKQFAGRINGGTFVYENMNGTVYTNSLPACDTIQFQASLDTLYKSSAQTINWIGNPLAPDESVGIYIGNGAWGEAALAWQADDGATGIVLGTNKLSSFTVGTTNIHMDRQIEKSITQGTSKGGKIRNRYRALTKSIYIAD